MKDQIITTNLLPKLFVGMDLHKNTSTLCVKTYDGAVITSKKISTDKNDVTEFIKSIKKKSDDISLALEPVSQWYYYADLIENLGVDVHLAHPMRVKAIASARIKTDKIDASVLSDLLRSNLLPEAYFSPREVRGWKEQCRFRASLVNLRTQVKNKIHAILFKHSLRHNFSNLFGKGGRNWLQSLSLKEPFQSNLNRYLALLDQITALIELSETDIKNTVTNHKQANLLVSIPGVSYCSALTIMAEIGDINRFKSCKQLQSYAGLVPSTYNSGDKQIHGRITKQGSKWLRWIMVEAAHHQQRCKRIPGFGSYYNAKKKLKGSKTATVATARKLLAVVWRLLKDDRPFERTSPHCRKSGRVAQKISTISPIINLTKVK
jgi:transposase